jgi:hypothetical protein
MILTSDSRKARTIQNAFYGAAVRIADYSYMAGRYASALERGDVEVADRLKVKVKNAARKLSEYFAAMEKQL